MKIPLIVILLAVALSVAQVLYYAPQLPEHVATTFKGDGSPGGWMPRTTSIGFYLVMQLFLALLFGGLAFAMPRLPTKSFSLPKRDYWLAPERRQATITYLQNQIGIFGALTMLFMVWVMQLVFQANLADPPRLPSTFLFALICFLAYTAIWTTQLIVHFVRVPASAGD